MAVSITADSAVKDAHVGPAEQGEGENAQWQWERN